MTKKKKICCTFLIKILGFIEFKVMGKAMERENEEPLSILGKFLHEVASL